MSGERAGLQCDVCAEPTSHPHVECANCSIEALKTWRRHEAEMTKLRADNARLLAALRTANRDGHPTDCFCASCEDRRALLSELDAPSSPGGTGR